jgi:hypothetical protein
MHQEKVPAKAIHPAITNQKPMHQNAPAARPALTPEAMMDLVDRDMAKTKVSMAAMMHAMAS